MQFRMEYKKSLRGNASRRERKSNNKKKFSSRPFCLPCHAQTVDYFGSTLCRCLEQSPQLRMIKLSGFPSPTVSVYELYLLILVSLWRERERGESEE